MRDVTWRAGAVLLIAITARQAFAAALVESSLVVTRETGTAAPLRPAAGAEFVDQPATAAHREQGYLVYKCTGGGQVVLSDQPCGPQPEVRRINPADINTYEAPAVPRTRSVDGSRSRVTRPAAGRAPAAKPLEATCDRLATELQRMQSRMRAGYRSREGERLREQQRRLKERHFTLGCRFL